VTGVDSRVGVEQFLEAVDALEKRPHLHDAVVAPAKVRVETGPRPVLGARDETGAYRVHDDVSGCRDQMVFAHGDRREPVLEQMTGPAMAAIHA
jgi:hypothetical protein